MHALQLQITLLQYVLHSVYVVMYHNRYVVVASTGYADVNVNTITTVLPETDRAAPPTQATVYGLTNGLVYTFIVVAQNAFGSGEQSLRSNEVCNCIYSTHVPTV
jgi:hypothetical protein